MPAPLSEEAVRAAVEENKRLVIDASKVRMAFASHPGAADTEMARAGPDMLDTMMQGRRASALPLSARLPARVDPFPGIRAQPMYESHLSQGLRYSRGLNYPVDRPSREYMMCLPGYEHLQTQDLLPDYEDDDISSVSDVQEGERRHGTADELTGREKVLVPRLNLSNVGHVQAPVQRLPQYMIDSDRKKVQMEINKKRGKTKGRSGAATFRDGARKGAFIPGAHQPVGHVARNTSKPLQGTFEPASEARILQMRSLYNEFLPPVNVVEQGGRTVR